MTDDDPRPSPDPATPASSGPSPGAEGTSASVGYGPRRPVVVGIGASAGGLEAFQTFFAGLPPDTGMAFVLVSHLDPTHDSMLAELLGRHTDMEVVQATDGREVEADHVYVIPPNSILSIRDGRLRLAPPRGEWGHRSTLDHFFQSLAEDFGPSAVSIILSGTGSDGTVGLRAIKEHGGLTMAQAEGSAMYYGMPASAAATGQVDHVLPVEDMPAVLVDYVGNLGEMQARGAGLDDLVSDDDERLARILHHLRSRVGHDFSDYKRSTMARRVQRRMQVLGLTSPSDYLERVRDDDAEARLLFQDLLIGVTRFFRDPAAYEALDRQVLPEIFAHGSPSRDVRLWVPGCATGEEAYSLAILLCERMEEQDDRRTVQIFATDIDGSALETARAGYYPETISGDLSAERLEAYFHREGDQFRVDKRLRETCIFSHHDLIRDPPFSRLDLISCRNLLIYFDPELQRRVLPLFHYALRPGGFLFLGPSEGGTATEDLFVAVSPPQRLFRARDTVARPPVEPLFHAGAAGGRTRPQPGRAPARRSGDLGDIAERVLFEEYGLPFVVINNRDEVIHFSGRTGSYLEPAPGAPSPALLGMARRGLAVDLRTLIRDARETLGEARRERVRFRGPAGYELVDLAARPLPEAGKDSELIMVVFQRVRESEPSLGRLDLESLTDEDDMVRHLEHELRDTREHLQSTIEELETSNEELKSSNEELLSTNEELQTSKEELQSTNEELETVNAELAAKLEELAGANGDLKNLFESTQIAIVFLDPEQRVKRFTPAAREVFQLIATDVGRPLSDVSNRLAGGDLQAEVERVMESGEVLERQVHAHDGSWYMLRIRPYVSLDGAQNGTVITLVDVSELKAAEAENERLNQALFHRVEELETILDVVPVGISISQDPEARRIRVNRVGAAILGIEPGSEASKSSGEEVRYRVLRDGEEVAPDELPMQRAARTGERTEEVEYVIERDDGVEVEILMRATPLVDAEGRVRSAVGAFLDISDRQRTNELVVLRAEQQQAVAELGVAALATSEPEEIFTRALEVVRETLGTPLVKLLAHLPEADEFLLRAGVGWQGGLIGEATVAGGLSSQAGYTLDSGEPVIVLDVHDEGRFGLAPLLAEHCVASGVSVVVSGPGRPWGVMGAHTTERREFSRDDVHFVQAVANVVGAALERQRVVRELAETQQEVALQTAQARLRRAERLASVGTLAAGIAHEITNPVNSILMTAEAALLAGGEDDDGAVEAVEAGGVPDMGTALRRIAAEAERAGMVVRDVLDFSRAEHTRPARQDLNQVVEAAVRRCRRFLKSPPEVDTELGDGVPEVMVAPLEIEQVLVNLLRNALEAAGGEVRITISTEAGPTGGARLMVADDGPGMSRETVAKIFDPFFTTRRREGGTGLGLSLVHSIIEDHDGEIDVQSTPGEGTRFVIDLPAAAQASPAVRDGDPAGVGVAEDGSEATA